ncbi:MAG: LptF/LptG family permease [Puniceicoccales bacterium]|jgi:lipopolysaccharide export LptBFGC system permease protein LptF|nr:LptF/LptG family permease [Puniceicoccales bacterium]
MIYRRQIFLSTARLTFLATSSLVFLFLLGNAVRDALQLFVGGRMDVFFLLRMLLTFVPAAFAYALPIGTVLAVLAIMGRMAANGEILALETAGLSRLRMAVPVVLWSCLCCAVALWATLFVAPSATYGYKRQLQEFICRDPIRFLRPHTFVREFPNCIIYAGGRSGQALTNLHIWELGDGPIPETVLHAANGEFSMGDGGASLNILLRNGFMERLGAGKGAKIMNFDKFSFRVECDKIFSDGTVLEKKLRHMTLFELVAARGTWSSGAQSTEMGGDERRRMDRNMVNFTIQQNISTAFAIVPLSIIAFHMALRMGRRETSMNGVVAVGLCLAYYSISMAISWLQGAGSIRADWLVWAPNAILLALSIALFRRKFN